MNDTDLDLLVASAARVRDLDVARWDLDGVARDLRDAVASMPLAAVPSDDDAPDVLRADLRPFERRSAVGGHARWLWLVAGAAAAVLVAVAIAAIGTAGDDDVQPPAGDASGTTAPPPPSPEDLAMAEALPRLAPTTPGWAITAVEYDGAGSVVLGDGTDEVVVRWYPAAEYENRTSTSGTRRAPDRPATIAGRPAVTFTEPDDGLAVDGLDLPTASNTDERMTFRWAFVLLDDHVVSIAGDLDATRWATLLAGLVQLRPAGWLTGLPEHAVTPSRYGPTVDEVLADVPLPPGIDLDALRSGPRAVLSRDHVAIEAIDGVVCGWAREWLQGREAGDEARTQAAVDAMAGARHWDALVDAYEDPSWAHLAWDWADIVTGRNSLALHQSPQAAYATFCS